MTDFSKPIEVDDVLLAFPADVRHLMPTYAEIPEEFHRWSNEWNEIAGTWFHRGLNPDVKFYLRDGVDGDLMMRHLKCIMGSFQPKHEHKLAAVGYLLSLWCTKVKNYEP